MKNPFARPANPYTIPIGEVVNVQTERRQAERIPTDWDEYRKALIDSGLVEERRKARNA